MVDPLDRGDPSAGGPMSEVALDIGEGFDADQWAMHGLLSMHYDMNDADGAALAEHVITRIHNAQDDTAAQPSSPAGATHPRWLSRINEHVRGRRRRWIVSGLVAACVLIGLILFRSPSTNGLAVADIVCAPSPPLAGFWIDPGDKAALRVAEGAIEVGRAA
ncbi:MAG: hypothetical protein O7B26_11205, partial [Planctomycetota bacterium]|nr:hypothetical protein [Planctomycetota bacterium]